ncbi:MAG: peroxiredoxin [Verrucomicrobia bacterium]|jgi:peroxiredoxin Q/BCP|nr:peroxiredoxin [Verrucomicrobiota bacterium]
MSSAKPSPLQPGDAAPDVTAPTQDGQLISLRDFRGRPVVLYFYPKDNTPGCTTESCGFRDHYAQLQAKGAVLLGVSGDSVKSHAKFATKYSLPFPLLADTDLAIAKAFGVWGEKKFIGLTFDGIHRMTFLIGADGLIKKTWTKVKTSTHAAEVLAALDS